VPGPRYPITKQPLQLSCPSNVIPKEIVRFYVRRYDSANKNAADLMMRKAASLITLQGLILDEKRQLAYLKHNSKIQTDNQNPEEVADYIVSALKLGWDIYQPHTDI
jgi:hypothetical protein